MQRILRRVDYDIEVPTEVEQQGVALEIALEHVSWLRRNNPNMKARTAAELLGAGHGATQVFTWDQCAICYARAWINL